MTMNGPQKAMPKMIVAVILAGVLIGFISLWLHANHLLQQESYVRAEEVPVNLFTNPSFENGMTGWTIWEKEVYASTEQAHDGSRSAKMQRDGEKMPFVRQSVPLTPGQSYTYRSWHKVSPQVNPPKVRLLLEDGNTVISEDEFVIDGLVSADWQLVEHHFTVPSAAAAPVFTTINGYYPANYPYFIDHFELFESEPVVIEDPVMHVTLSDQAEPLTLEYVGTNGYATTAFDNTSKYYADVMHDLSRIFGTALNYTPDDGLAVTDAAGFEAAKAAVKQNPQSNAYLSLDELTQDLAEYMAQDAKFVTNAALIAELRRLGSEPLVVVGPWGQIAADNYARLWELWKKQYAISYFMAKQYGVTHFNVMNEPDHFITAWDGYIKVLQEEADAIRAGVAAAGETAVIWAPTFAGNNETVLNLIAQQANDAIDVYDFHMYNANTTAYRNRILQYENRIKLNNDGELKPIAMSEFNYALAKDIPYQDFNYMYNVFKNVNLMLTQAENGLYAPIRFMFPRQHRGEGINQPPSGIYTLGLVSVDDTTGNMTRPTKMYYGMRMVHRLLSSPKERVELTVTDAYSKSHVMATRDDDNYFVLVTNEDTAAIDVTVDVSAAVSASVQQASFRLTGIHHDDVFLDLLPIVDGEIALEGLPERSMALLVIPRNQAQPDMPVIHRAFAHDGGIELWWSNADSVDYFEVERAAVGANGELGAFTTIAAQENHAFYTDATAEPGVSYHYRVTAWQGGAVSNPSQSVGPLTLAASGLQLPYKKDFEENTDAGWVQASGQWAVTTDYEDTGYATSPGANEVSMALTGTGNAWGSVFIESRVHLKQLGDEGSFGLVARYTDAANYYRFEYVADVNSLRIVKVAQGTEVVLAVQALGNELTVAPSDYRYRLYAVVDGGRLHLTMTREQQKAAFVEAFDADPLADGMYGFTAANDTEVFFDGISLYPYMNSASDSGANANNNSSDADWDIIRGNWHDVLYQKNKAASNWNIAVSGHEAWTDYLLSAKVHPVAFANPPGKMALFARYQDEQNYYRYELSGDGQFRAVKKVDGVETVLAQAAFPAAEQQDYVVAVLIDKNLHTVWINGMPVLTFASYEPVLAQGKIGVGTWKGSGVFSEVTVNDFLTMALSQ